MLGAFILSMPQRPEVDRMTDYYAKSMMTKPMQWLDVYKRQSFGCEKRIFKKYGFS